MKRFQENYQSYFEQLFRDAPESVEGVSDQLCTVAKFVWFKGFTPNLEPVVESELPRAAYFIDFLTQNPVVDSERRKELNAALEFAVSRLSNAPKENETLESFIKGEPQKKKNRDQLAAKWHLGKGMPFGKVPELLNLQRRANLQKQAN